MGLFSNLRAAVSSGPSPAEATARAVLTIPLLAAASDGQIEENEANQIINMCAFNPIFLTLGGKRTSEIAAEITAALRSRGAEACFAEAKAALGPKQVETAMCFAIRVTLADGQVNEAEIRTLSAMGERLGLPFETFEKIFSVMVMMQRAA